MIQIPHNYIKDSSEVKFHDCFHYLNTQKQQTWTVALEPVNSYCSYNAFEYSGWYYSKCPAYRISWRLHLKRLRCRNISSPMIMSFMFLNLHVTFCVQTIMCLLLPKPCSYLSKDESESENLDLNVKWKSTVMSFTVVDYVLIKRSVNTCDFF